MSADYRAVFDELTAGDGFSCIFFADTQWVAIWLRMAGDAARHSLRLCAALLQFVRRWIWCVRRRSRAPQRYFYQRRFVLGLNAVCEKVEIFRNVIRATVWSIRTVREFDGAITTPQFGYRDAQEYQAAGKRLVDKVRVRYS
jgi:predicted alpha/beta-fold hydrolase